MISHSPALINHTLTLTASPYKKIKQTKWQPGAPCVYLSFSGQIQTNL